MMNPAFHMAKFDCFIIHNLHMTFNHISQRTNRSNVQLANSQLVSSSSSGLALIYIIN